MMVLMEVVVVEVEVGAGAGAVLLPMEQHSFYERQPRVGDRYVEQRSCDSS